MSTDYRPLGQIRMADLFDGRLEHLGLHQHHHEWQTSDYKCLTDGRNFLWVYCNMEGLVLTFTSNGLNNKSGRILGTITDEFDVAIVSAHQPQFWGYETEEEWRADSAAKAEKREQDFYNEVVKFVRGESHNIRRDTIDMIQAEIAKQLIAVSPDLLAEHKRPDLIKAVKAIKAIYDRDHKVTTVPEFVGRRSTPSVISDYKRANSV